MPSIPIAALLLASALSSQGGEGALRRDMERAVSDQKERKWERAARRYRDILARSPELVAARIYLAQSLWFSGDEEGARAELEAARRAAPETLLPLLLLARLEGRDSGELANAVPLPPVRGRLISSVLLEGESLVTTERPALLLASLGDLEGALRDYRAAAAIDPWNVELHRQVGSALFKAGRTLEAVSAFERAVALEPKDAGSWGQLGSSYLRLMWWEPAIEALEKATALEGEKPAGLLALGYAYERKPDFEKSVELYRRAGELAPRWAQAPYRLGRALIKLDRLEDAERALGRALDLDPGMAEAACFLGAVLLDRRAVAEATLELERAVALRPRFAKAHFYLGQAYLRAGRVEEARSALATYERLIAESGAVEPP